MPALPVVVGISSAANGINIINRDERAIDWHGVFAFIMQMLGTLVQVKYQGQGQGKTITVFQSHSKHIYTFIVVVSAYAGAFLASHEPSMGTRHSTLTCTAYLLGALANIVLLIMLEPLLGWAAFTIWAIFFIRVAVSGIYNYLYGYIYRKVKGMFEVLSIMFRHQS